VISEAEPLGKADTVAKLLGHAEQLAASGAFKGSPAAYAVFTYPCMHPADTFRTFKDPANQKDYRNLHGCKVDVEAAHLEGGEAVLPDGTLIPTHHRTGTANRSNCNGKHKKHGLLFLALTDENGNLTWISPAHRGAASEITAARHDHLAQRLRAAGLGALADPGFTGLDPDPGDPVIITGWKSTRTSKTTPAQRQADQALSAARAPAGHAFSDLRNWRILTLLRLNPARATTLLRALLVLTRQHTTR